MAASFKRFSTVISRPWSLGSMSDSTGSSSEGEGASSTTDQVPDLSNSPTTSSATTRASTPEPAITASHLTCGAAPVLTASLPLPPLKRTFSRTSTTLMQRLSISPAKSDAFVDFEAEKRKQAAKAERATAKRIREFHRTISGAVFVGTVRYTGKGRSSYDDSVDGEGAKKGDALLTPHRGIQVTDIRPQDFSLAVSPPRSTKAMHFQTFANFYNQNGMECYFDVFMKRVPLDGSEITFFATPAGEKEDEYVAVACNIVRKIAE